MRWRVVWARCEVMLTFCPTRRLSKVDLPAFGRPIITTNPLWKPWLGCLAADVTLVIGFALQKFASASGGSLLGITTAAALALHGFFQAWHATFHDKALLVRITAYIQHAIGRRGQRLALKKLLQTCLGVFEDTVRVDAVQDRLIAAQHDTPDCLDAAVLVDSAKHSLQGVGKYRIAIEAAAFEFTAAKIEAVTEIQCACQ